ncbi:hypothetical protein [Halorussus halophilus]|uniref:hypothetical protein n=1 Tax=Halorussus halophilus TaxID=2650975 RepID=UPI001300F642|nr:hypothetical protein [Halorussus halophilus]
MADELSSSSKHVTGQENKISLNTPTPILTWTVPDAEMWEIKEGVSAVADFETTTDNSGPAGGDANPSLGSQFGMAYREKDAPLNEWTMFAVFTVDAFNQLSIAQQQDGRASDRRIIEFDDRVIDEDTTSLTFETDDQIALVTNCDDTMDPNAIYYNYDMTVYRN